MAPGQFKKEQVALHEPCPLTPSLSPARSGGEGAPAAAGAGEGECGRFMFTEQFKKEQAASHEPR